MPVKVTLSYLGLEEHVEFEGYVRRVLPNFPYGIECEDSVYFLRRTNLNKSWKDTTLKAIIKYLSRSGKCKTRIRITMSGQLPDVNFKQFRYDNVNAAQALKK
jgi:hypothetical protein